LVTAVALVIGQVIGSGVFYKPSIIAQSTGGFVGLILFLWVACGMVNLCGALAIAELGAMLPHAGGNYVYLREAYGRMPAFLWGWAEFWVIRSGAIAALGTAMAISLFKLWASLGGEPPGGQQTFEKTVAVAAIAISAAINIGSTIWGGAVQNITTAIKAGFLVFLGVLPFVAVGAGSVELGPLFPSASESTLLLSIGSALAGIMWAYDGWGQVTVVAEEIHNPQRNVPRALAGGVIALIVLYFGANLGYHLTLPSSAIAASQLPAEDVTRKLLGEFGARLLLAMILVSTFGAMSSNVLVGPRVLFAVARDHHFLRLWRRIDPRFGTPAIAIGTVSLWSIVLVLAGDMTWLFGPPVPGGPPPKPLFDVLTDYAIFGGSVFYFLAVAAVFVLRYRRPDAERPFRTWGYPVTPLVFLVFYLFLLVSMFTAAPMQCGSGLLLIVAGMAVFAIWGRRGNASA
ncbi:MAG: APC family permease, partial [Pirellulales bacterium]